jgi:PAS domain S-box-containing protein
VETEAQMTFLQIHGCNEVQGHYFSRPVVAVQLVQMLATGVSPCIPFRVKTEAHSAGTSIGPNGSVETICSASDRAQRYLDIAEVILLALDLDGRISMTNCKRCSTLGCEEHELLGQNWIEKCLPVETREPLRAKFDNVIAADLSYIENPILTKSDEERIIGWRNTLLRDEAGLVIGSLSSREDISTHARTEETLRTTQAQLQSLLASSAR